jgi:hypothetical protein
MGARGVCALTLEGGVFVRSHILPKALTGIGEGGKKATEHGLGHLRPKRRPPGWYDEALVTKKGEDILARVDNNGIRELRDCGLIWSSENSNSIAREVLDDSAGTGLARIYSKHPERLRLFFLSLLWRASASRVSSMEHHQLPEDNEERLRELTATENIGAPNEFRIYLTLITGERFPHNHTPIREAMEFGGRQIMTSRIYLDGLIARLSDRDSSGFPFSESDAFDVGYNQKFSVFTVDGPKSRQLRDNVDVLVDTLRIRSESQHG